MNRNRHGVVVSFIAVCIWLCATAHGAPDDNHDPLLRGPEVAHDGRSIVQYDFSGALHVLEQRPEAVAAGLLTIEPERRERIRTIHEQRDRRLALLLVDQIDVVVEITDAVAAGDSRTAQQLARFLYNQFNAKQQRDPLLDEYAAVLTDDELKEVQRLVDEYWDALIDRTVRDAEQRGADARQRAEQQHSFELFQKELRAAYNWSLGPYREKLEQMYEIVEPTGEQKTAMRKAVVEFVRAARLEPTEAQRRELARTIYEILDERRRRMLFEFAWWRM